MKSRIVVGMVVCAVLAAGVAIAQTGKPAADDREHDFGNVVVGVTVTGRGKEPEGGGWYLEKATVRRLGDRYFVKGQPAELNERYKKIREMTPTIWIPLADVVGIVEFENMEKARAAMKMFD